MPTNRPTVLNVRQWGEEGTSTPGTAVAADHIAPNLLLTGGLIGDAHAATIPSGHLYQRGSTPGMFSAKGSYTLPFAYAESYVVLNSLLKKVTATGATLTKTRVWTPAVAALDTNQSYSAESGQTGAVDLLKYLLFNSLKFKISKTGMTPWTGDWLAQWNGLTNALTATPTVLASSLIAKTSWNAYTADTMAHLVSAPTQITNWADVDFEFGPFRSEAAFINSSNPGWDAAGIGVPKNSVKVTVPKDVSGSDYAGTFTLAKKLAGTLIPVRLAATGKLIETVSTVDYFEMMVIDLCLQIMGDPAPVAIGPFDGLQWPCELCIEPASNKAWEITTLSTQA